MSEWDPEAAGNAAIYLRLPEIQMLEIRNAPFTGGNQVWVPYADTGYTKAVIEDNQDGVKDGEIKVKRTVDMKARVSHIEPIRPRTDSDGPRWTEGRRRNPDEGKSFEG